MSASTASVPLNLPLIVGKVRAYFAPVTAGVASAFDAAILGAWQNHEPPAPWIDLGWLTSFKRFSDSQVIGVESGSPATVQLQARQAVGARVQCQFERWNRLTMALSAGSDSRNILQTGNLAVPLGSASSSTTLYPSQPSGIAIGAFIVVDVDYTGQTGFVGAGSPGSYLLTASGTAGDVDYIRRCSWNTAQVSAVRSDGSIELAGQLLAGTPTAGMKLQAIVGFSDREGGTFFPEWSGLFIAQGMQGEKLYFYYPRLQSLGSASEATQQLGGDLRTLWLDEIFRALPVMDVIDGCPTVCYRGFLPATACKI